MNEMVASGQRGSQAYKDLQVKAGTLTNEIKGLNREFRGQHADIKRSSSFIKDFTTSLGLSIVSAAGLAMALQKLGRIAIDEFLESDKAASQLFFALDKNSVALDRLTKFADELSKKTIFDDDDIVKAEAFLVAQERSEDQIKKIIIAATNLQAVKGGDLNQWVEQLDGMLETGTIPKSLIKIDGSFKTLSKTEIRNGEVVDIINKKYEGFAENLGNTSAGKIEKFKNKFSNSLGDMVKDIVKFTDTLPTFGIKIQMFFEGLLNSLANFAKSMKEFWEGVPILGSLFGGISGFAEEKLRKAAEDFKYIVPKTGDYNVPLPPGYEDKTKKKKKSGDDDEKREKKRIDLWNEFITKLNNEIELLKERNQWNLKTTESKLDELEANEKLAKTLKDQIEFEKKKNELLRERFELGGEPKGAELKSQKPDTTPDLTKAKTFKIGEAKPLTHGDFIELLNLEEETYQKIGNQMTDAFSQSLNLASQIGQYLGEGAQEVIGAFQQAFQFVQMIIQLIQTIKTISSLFSLIPGGGAVAAIAGGGGATGGLIRGPGTGTSDSIPLWVSDYEFLVNARATKQYLPLLQAINSGSRYLDLFDRAQTGGIVSNRGTQPTIINKIFIRGTLSGQKFLNDELAKFNRRVENSTL